MVDYTYYCVVRKDYNHFDDISPGTYSFTVSRKRIGIPFNCHRIMTVSSKVWKQGPKGGVKIIKDGSLMRHFTSEYVTTNEKLMKEFMWDKLQAQKLTGYN